LVLSGLMAWGSVLCAWPRVNAPANMNAITINADIAACLARYILILLSKMDCASRNHVVSGGSQGVSLLRGKRLTDEVSKGIELQMG
jgi:hypothetical protein